ncbi:hypothetical protein G9A89_010914 [Geosiphon pyriformis]|nr:hypothetical protein G9A89_010914 [Geosiphon pyriformis]
MRILDYFVRKVLINGRCRLVSLDTFVPQLPIFARLPAKERETLKVSTQRYQKDMKRANILIYKAPKGTYTKMVLWQFAAALQLTFWANLTDIYWRVSKESDNSNASPEKSTLPKRVLIIGGMALVAVGIASVMLIIPARTIMSMKILKNGITAQLETGRSIPWGRTRNIPLKNLTTNELLCNGLGQSGIDSKAKLNAPIFIRAKDEQLAYMLDRNGNYENPKLFDALFYEPPTNKKP